MFDDDVASVTDTTYMFGGINEWRVQSCMQSVAFWANMGVVKGECKLMVSCSCSAHCSEVPIESQTATSCQCKYGTLQHVRVKSKNNGSWKQEHAAVDVAYHHNSPSNECHE